MSLLGLSLNIKNTVGDLQAGVGDAVGGKMLPGGATIFGIPGALRHFAVGDLVDKLRPQRLLIEGDGGSTVAAKKRCKDSGT